MKCALVVVDDPNATDTKNLNLYNVVNEVKNDETLDTDVLIINAGAYLCSFENGLGCFNRLVSVVESREFHYRTLFFEEPPSWVTS